MIDNLDLRLRDKERAQQMKDRDLMEDTFVELCALSRRVGEQNGRVRKAEDWIAERSTIEKFVIGLFALFGGSTIVTAIKVFF